MQIVFVGKCQLLFSGLKAALAEEGAHIAGSYASVSNIPAPNQDESNQMIYLLKHSADDRSVRDQIAELKTTDPNARIAVLAEQISPQKVVDVYAEGGDGLILEDIGVRALYTSLKLILLGEKVFPSQLAPLLSAPLSKQRVLPCVDAAGLSPREIEIVRCLTAGMSNKAIANELDIAVATVKVHIKSTLKKLGFKNRTQAAIWGLEAGLANKGQVTGHMAEVPPGTNLARQTERRQTENLQTENLRVENLQMGNRPDVSSSPALRLSLLA